MITERRNNAWLAERLRMLHRSHFSDVPIPNPLFTRFGRQARNRLGSIISKRIPGHDQPVTYITINGRFRQSDIPDYVIDATLLHEFTHYAHGFHSPHPRKYKHPHLGGIVTKEIQARGGGNLLRLQKRWIRDMYPAILHENSKSKE